MKPAGAYRFRRAIRPFSYTVAIAACGLGTVLALQQGYGNLWLALLIIGAGVLIQAAVNLINDHADLPVLESCLQAAEGEARREWAEAIEHVRRYHALGMIFFGVSLLIGLGLVLMQGWPLLVIIILGLLGGYFYSAEPVHYKRRGLGVVLVFWFMGVLLVGGSAMAMGAPMTLSMLAVSIPFSLLTSLVLLANEIRDHEEDRRHGLGTLTVRIGLDAGRYLYVAMLVGAYLVSLGLWLAGLLPWVWQLLFSLPLAFVPLMKVVNRQADRSDLPPLTGKLFAVFALLFLCAFVLELAL
ncbi:prenyltransferase [Ectothiorhodospira shaposhnikovii]|uniref:prenyltransferase n=1 Tax=Ectothiorhodospira shaposhnikovii TaxID=1054 RepID=UPI001EE8B7D8|nr:prenyltransferase [Ectothiorhodospira shaposhnikovii]MCG5512016.1 prenyltransferase [Ectothiorhodospira shaposhnikovii]